MEVIANSSNETGISEHRRIAYISTTATQTAIAVYTLLTLLYYEFERRRGKSFHRITSRKNMSTHTYSSDPSSAPASTTTEKSKTKTSSSVLRIMCIVSTMLTIIRILLELIELAPNRQYSGSCQAYIIPIVIAYSTALASIYFILWYRLYIFLSHPAMKHLSSKWLKIFGYFVLFLIFAAAFSYTILYVGTTESVDGHGGCKLSTTDNATDRARFIILTFSSVIAQVALLGLFIYPLLKHRATMQSFYNTKSNSTSETTTMSPTQGGKVKRERSTKRSKFSASFTSSVSRKRNRQMKRQVAIIVVIKRVMLTAIVCILSDIITGIMATALRTQARIVTNLMFDSNLLVNLLCVIISFKDWRSRISFNCYKSREKHLPVKTHSKSLQIKTGSNNNLLDSGAAPATPISPGVFSNGTTITPLYSANVQPSPSRNVFFDEKSGSTSNTAVDL